MDKQIHENTPRAVLNAVDRLETAGLEVSYADAKKVAFRDEFFGTAYLVSTTRGWIMAYLKEDGRWEASTTKAYRQRTGLSAIQSRFPDSLPGAGVRAWRSALDAARDAVEAMRAA